MRHVAIRALVGIATEASVAALAAGLRRRVARGPGRDPARARRARRPARLAARQRILLSEAFDIGTGPVLRSWAAWVVQEIGDAGAVELLGRAVARRDGLDGGVLIRYGVIGGAAVADRIDGYRDARLRVPYWFRGEAQDAYDQLVRDLRAGRGAERYRPRPRDDIKY